MTASVARLLPIVALSAVLGAQAQTSTPVPPAAQPLVLHILEVPEQGRTAGVCPDTIPSCTADIKSTLDITPDLSHVPSRSGRSGVIDPVDSARRDQINLALKALNRSLERSRDIVTMMASTPGATAQLNAMSESFEADRNEMMNAIVAYEQLEPANAGKSRRDILRLPEVRTMFGDPNANPPVPPTIGQFLADRIEELNRRAADRVRAAAASSGYTMKLGVFRIRKGTDPMPVHLPNYDTYGTLSPAQLPRITTNVSDAEAAENAREVKATMDLVALTKTDFAALADAYKKQLDTLGQKLQQQVAALTSGSSNATGLIADVTKLANDLKKLGAQQNDAALQKTGTDLEALATAIQALATNLTGLQQSIATTTTNFSKVTTGAVSPDVVLRNILGLATTGIGQVTQGAQDASAQLKTIQTSLATVVADAKNLTAAAQTSTQSIADRIKSELVDLLAGPLAQLVGPDLAQFIANVRATTQAAAPLLTLNAPEILTVSNIVPTSLQIPRADPADGDVLDFSMQLFQGTDTTVPPVYEEHRSVTVHFYGWHSGLASGLIFVRANRTRESNFKPEAAAAWRIEMTPRPEDTNVFHRLRPAIGIHTTTLHFTTTTDNTTTNDNNNNNNVQFGAGLTLHLFGDILQAGYGWNLGVTTNRGYMYVGLGIMKLLRARLGGTTNE